MKKPYPARAAGPATPKVPKTTKAPAKVAAKPTAKPARVMKTTKTPDGGQQYVRNNDYKVAGAQSRAYKDRLFQGKTVNPKIAAELEKADSYALVPDDKGMAERAGKRARRYADEANAITRKYGADRRR